MVKGYRTALFVIRGQRCYPSFVLEPQGPRAPHAAEDHVDIVGMTEACPALPACRCPLATASHPDLSLPIRS